MNKTLFSCGFKKEIETRKGQRYDVTSSQAQSVKLKTKKVSCKFCTATFTSDQYLNTHLQFKHKSEISDVIPTILPTVQTFKEQDIESDDACVDVTTSDNPGPGPNKFAIKSFEKVASSITASSRRGQNQRKSYTIEFKMQTLKLLDALTERKVKNRWQKCATEQGIPNKSMVIKWNKERSKIFAEATLNTHKKNRGNIKVSRQRRRLLSKRPSRNEHFSLAAKLVVAEFKLRRARGAKVSKLWLCKTMKSKITQIYGEDEAKSFKASGKWFQRFKQRHKISLRRRTNKKKDSADEGRSVIQDFHMNLRKAVQSQRRRGACFDEKYGRWLPEKRFNVDQVPLPFVVGQDTTYATAGSEQVWVSQPSSGLEKRQATLQLCIRASSEQTVKPAIIFRGKGNIKDDERSKYDSRVDVYFQEHTWMDEEVNMRWLRNTLTPGVKNEKENVLFADNVSFQLAEAFHRECRTKINTIVYLLPPNHTDKVQPIDAGFGKTLKAKIGESMERWLEKEDHIDKWHGKISAKERRVLMTEWVGEAWEEGLDKYNF
eukprot:gene14571-16073_t